MILFCWVSVQRLLLLSLQEACTLFCTFVGSLPRCIICVLAWETIPEAVSCLSHHIILDDSELEEAWSSVLLGLTAMVPPTRPMAVALEGLEDWQVLALLVQDGTRSSFHSQFGHVIAALRGAGFGPCLNFWGADMGPLSVIVRWTAGRVVSLSLRGIG